MSYRSVNLTFGPKSGIKKMSDSDRVRACYFGLGPGSGFKMRSVYNSGLAIVTYNAWNKTPESIFQTTRGQWGTFVHPGSLDFYGWNTRYGCFTQSQLLTRENCEIAQGTQ